MHSSVLFFVFLIFGFLSAQADPLILNSKNDFDDLGKVSAVLKWEKNPDAAYYYLTVSQHNDFKLGRVFKTAKNKMFLRVYPNTKYFWKFEALNKDNVVIDTPPKALDSFLVKHLGPIPERHVASTKTEDQAAPCDHENREPDSETKISTTDAYTYDSANPYSLWLTTEAGYIDFKQTHSSLSSADSSGSMFPSLGVNFQTRNYWNAVSFKAFFQQVIGNFESNQDSTVLINNDFQWSRYGGSAYWDATTVSFLSRDLNIRPYLGIEQQKTPYFTALSLTSISIQDMDMLSAIAGVRFELKNESRWSYLLDLSYGQTLSGSTDDISVSDISGNSFEAQVGTQYTNPTSGFFLGGALKGAIRSFEETLTTQTNISSTGERKVDYYSIEGFAGFRF